MARRMRTPNTEPRMAAKLSSGSEGAEVTVSVVGGMCAVVVVVVLFVVVVFFVVVFVVVLFVVVVVDVDFVVLFVEEPVVDSTLANLTHV